jgi:hypothetical protein
MGIAAAKHQLALLPLNKLIEQSSFSVTGRASFTLASARLQELFEVSS